MTARMTIPLCLLALAASACGSARTERGAQPRHPRPPAVYTVGRTLLGLPGHESVALAAAPVTPLAGWLTPVATTEGPGYQLTPRAERRLDDAYARIYRTGRGTDPADRAAGWAPLCRLPGSRGFSARSGRRRCSWSAGRSRTC